MTTCDVFFFFLIHPSHLDKLQQTNVDHKVRTFSLSLVFICREKTRQFGISLLPDRPRLFRLMKTGNPTHPQSSGMVTHKINWENHECFYCHDTSQFSAMVGNHCQHLKTQACTIGDMATVQLITSPLYFFVPVLLFP